MMNTENIPIIVYKAAFDPTRPKNKTKRSKVKVSTNYGHKYLFRCAECGLIYASRSEAERCSERGHLQVWRERRSYEYQDYKICKAAASDGKLAKFFYSE